MTNDEMAQLIDLAVYTLKDVQAEHNQPTCNCFRVALANECMALGFCGYDKLGQFGHMDIGPLNRKN